MQVLVIGGTGPTGPFIIDGLLKRGYEILILHRGFHEVPFPSEVQHIHCDPNFTESIEKALGEHRFDLVICTYGRLRLLIEVMKKRTTRFIAVGGEAYRTYIEAKNNMQGCPVPVPENAPLVSDPAMDKFSYLINISEQAVHNAHIEGYCVTTYLRYPTIYGPRQLAAREWSIMRRILDGRKIIIIPDNGLRLRSRGYAENMAHALLLAVDHPDITSGKSYNLADERMLSLREWISIIAKTMNWDGELVSLPHSVAKPSYPYAGSQYFHQIKDISRIQIELGYHDLVRPEEGIGKTVQWYLENHPTNDGELERQLGDPFDYLNEDRLITEFRQTEEHLQKLPFAGFERHHSYPHPKVIGDKSELSTYTID